MRDILPLNKQATQNIEMQKFYIMNVSMTVKFTE
jgi:hypothetical protein